MRSRMLSVVWVPFARPISSSTLVKAVSSAAIALNSKPLRISKAAIVGRMAGTAKA